MKKEIEVPESWSLCWSLLAVQRSVGMGNKARTFTSLTTLAKAAGCDSRVPRAFKALGYIRRAGGGLWLVDPTLGTPDWDEVRAWIAMQRARAKGGKKTITISDFRDSQNEQRHADKASNPVNLYHLLPDFVTFRYNGMQCLTRPAIVGGAGDMRLMYIGFELTVIIRDELKTFEDIDAAINDFLKKNKHGLSGQYFYIPSSSISEECILVHRPAIM
jgi:hypothetical protein